MTRLSVNINKFATLRNARGGNNPDLIRVAKECERFGAQGITVHPRPDERHIRYGDVLKLQSIVTTEFNIEGYPDDRYLELIEKVRPAQATLVPDPPDVITSNAGWDTIGQADKLKNIVQGIKALGIRTSIFVEPEIAIVEGAAEVGTDRIELYTEEYSADYSHGREMAVLKYVESAERARELRLGVNAGHDLNLDNLSYLVERIPFLDEISIGHAIVCDALYLGLENTIQMYLGKLGKYSS